MNENLKSALITVLTILIVITSIVLFVIYYKFAMYYTDLAVNAIFGIENFFQRHYILFWFFVIFIGVTPFYFAVQLIVTLIALIIGSLYALIESLIEKINK